MEVAVIVYDLLEFAMKCRFLLLALALAGGIWAGAFWTERKAADGREAAFETSFGAVAAKAKFNPKEMRYRGKPAF